MTCFECGTGILIEGQVQIEGTRSGEVFRISMDGLRCDRCGFQAVDSTQSALFTQLLSDAYRRKHGLMTGEEIRDRRNRLKMTQQEFADYIGVGVASVKRWENGQVQEKGLDELLRLKTDPEAARQNLKGIEPEQTMEGLLATVTLSPGSSFELRFSTEQRVGKPIEFVAEGLEVEGMGDPDWDGFPLAA
jgi:putative zinc finger/helix-turn-helix YgiT family protein